jgi:hypothetical protein
MILRASVTSSAGGVADRFADADCVDLASSAARQRQRSSRSFKSQKSPAAMRLPGSLGVIAHMGLGRRRDKQWLPTLTLSDSKRTQQRVAEINQWIGSHPVRMPAGDENGEHQRPAVKILIEVHRSSTAAAQQEQG